VTVGRLAPRVIPAHAGIQNPAVGGHPSAAVFIVVNADESLFSKSALIQPESPPI